MLARILKSENFHEVMPQIRSRSEVVILDFMQIKDDLITYKNIKKFFAKCNKQKKDPKLPENRQKFNNIFLKQTHRRYLIGRYGENRIEMLKGSDIAKVKRFFHQGLDVFARKLEPVFCPYDGIVVKVARERGKHSYGNFVVIRHETKGYIWYSVYGHLGTNRCSLGVIKKGDLIGQLGDYKNNVNGGWSRHLHFQLMLSLPKDGIPYAYSTREKLTKDKLKYPNPNLVLKIKNI